MNPRPSGFLQPSTLQACRSPPAAVLSAGTLPPANGRSCHPRPLMIYCCPDGEIGCLTRGRFNGAMRKAARYKRRWLIDQGWPWVVVLLLAAGVWIDAYGLPTWDRAVTVFSPSQPGGVASQIGARPVSPRDVIDGDSVRLHGQMFRLVGFNTPETGDNAQCAHERDLGNAATARLQSLIRTASRAELAPVQCSCPPGTHGTSECNNGRSCGILRLDGRDVGGILISEGLAHRYVCGAMSCPRRRPWC
jgi:endonuclease YncB( thermonuclease family)